MACACMFVHALRRDGPLCVGAPSPVFAWETEPAVMKMWQEGRAAFCLSASLQRPDAEEWIKQNKKKTTKKWQWDERHMPKLLIVK